MKRDVRDTDLYKEIEALFKEIWRPGLGHIADAAEIHASPNGDTAVFSGFILNTLEGTPPSRVCQVDLQSGDLRVLTFGPNVDRKPKYSPDGKTVAFLSDRKAKGDFQLYLLDAATQAVIETATVEGWVEDLKWSPDGSKVLLQVAGHGADTAGGQGAVTSKQKTQELPDWMPTVETGDENYRWRRTWVYDLATKTATQISPKDANIWEADWCGDDAVAAIVSPDPGEAAWYAATLETFSLDGVGADGKTICTPNDQLGCVASSPSGRFVAFVEAVCSDRGIIAGELSIYDTVSEQRIRIETNSVDVGHVEWRSETKLLFAGHRGFESVIGLFDVAAREVQEVWASRKISTAGRYMTVSGLGAEGDFLMISESFTSAPEIATVRDGAFKSIRALHRSNTVYSEAIASADEITWTAPDGLEIEGWLLKPHGDGPYPLILQVHGGPVWQWRPHWLGRGSYQFSVLALLQRGYAVFLPNPRGSSGRGQDFIRHVVGDIGGADAQDLLAGVDHLVETGLADPARLGVTGGSYGGFMSSWLITQDDRFAAAAPIVPHTNQTSHRLTANIPEFNRIFIGEDYAEPNNHYFDRSPIMHAKNVKTPTLNIAGALDRCTPPTQAAEFHNALLENGVTSALAIYPKDGHGVRTLPAQIDYVARVVSWFEEHINRETPQKD